MYVQTHKVQGSLPILLGYSCPKIIFEDIYEEGTLEVILYLIGNDQTSRLLFDKIFIIFRHYVKINKDFKLLVRGECIEILLDFLLDFFISSNDVLRSRLNDRCYLRFQNGSPSFRRCYYSNSTYFNSYSKLNRKRRSTLILLIKKSSPSHKDDFFD